MNLTKCKLGELVNVTRGMSLSGQYYSEKGELIRLTLGNFNMNGGGFKKNTSKSDLYFTGPVREEFILKKGDIITPLTEQSLGLLGTTARIPESGKYIQSQDVALVRCKPGKIDPNFCYYLVSSLSVKQQLSAAAQQTKIRHTSPEKIMSCTVWVPELQEQERIGALLTAIDSKIELNRSINRNLEALAKQLYDYWFVQFDFPDENGRPYKSSGGKMVWNEKLKRNIPQNWECVKIQEIAKTYSGGTPTSSKLEYYENGTIPWINSGELNNAYITSTSNFITELGLKESSAKLYPRNTILVALYGATAGKVSFLTFEACSNQAVCGVMLENPLMVNYTRFYLSNLLDYYILLSSGSARDNISQDTIKNTWFIKPDNVILNAFDQICQKTTQLIVANQIEIDNLTMQRDELLPLLMNGQITVNSDLSLD